VVKEGTLRPAGPAQVTIAPAAPPGSRQGGGPGWGGFGAGRQAKVLQYGAPALPREPLEGTGVGFAPLPMSLVFAVLVLPWGIFIWVWWGWIQRRAVLTDPCLPQKDALKTWLACIQEIENAKKIEEIVKPLILWQQSAFKFLGIKTAIPRAAEIRKVKPGILNKENMEILFQSYQTVEDALYGKDTGVKIGDWCERTKKIVGTVKFPSMRWGEIMSPKNLWPWVASLGLWMIPLYAEGQTNAPVVQDPLGLYREGSFEKAGQVWGERVRKNMTDPVSRNNLGLAWFQIGDKERALANGLSAYLVAPQTSSVGWNLEIFTNAADQLDENIRRLSENTQASWLTSLGGVFVWQLAMVAGNGLIAFGAGTLLASGYFAARRKILLLLGVCLVTSGIGAMSAAGVALATYGKLADRAAVMIVDVVPLRSVPTEVETQAEKAYPPGSIARREKQFLGWSKVRMPNQDAGWIRTEHLVPLY
jgi:hypothetical protein